MSTVWNNLLDTLHSSLYNPEPALKELAEQYHIERIETLPHRNFKYAAYTSDLNGSILTHTDQMVSVTLPKSSLEALAVCHKSTTEAVYSGKNRDVYLERELYLRRTNSAVAKAYEQYKVLLALAWEHKTE